MAGVYTTRFFLGTAVYPRASVSVPASRRWVLRDIEAFADAATELLITINGFNVLRQKLVADSHYQWSGRMALNGGDTLGIGASPAAMNTVCVTGYDFAA